MWKISQKIKRLILKIDDKRRVLPCVATRGMEEYAAALDFEKDLVRVAWFFNTTLCVAVRKYAGGLPLFYN